MNTDGQSPHILIINDSPDVLDLKQEVFEEEGFRVTTCLTFNASLDAITQLAPNLIIISYRSELETGLLHNLAPDSPLAQIPLVVCTADVRQVEAIKSELDFLGVAVVYMPFDIQILVQVVRTQLGLADSSEPLSPGAA